MVGQLLLNLLQGDPLQQAFQQGAAPAPGPQGGPPAANAVPGAPGPPAAPPLAPAQATQSPPDLTRLYLQLLQRNRAADEIDRGLTNVVAAFSPPAAQASVMANMPRGTDTGAELSNLMQLQQYGMGQQRLANLQAGLPEAARSLGMSLPMLQALFNANPEGMGTELTKLYEAKVGLTGDPAVQEMTRDKNQWILNNSVLNPDGTPKLDANGQPTLLPGKVLPDKFSGIEEYKATAAGKVASAQAQEKDFVADQHNYKPASYAYDRMISDAEKLLKEPGLDEIIGPVNQIKQPALTTGDTAKAFALYNKIMAEQYATGVQDFHGAGRITQQELNQDLPSQSIMKARNLTPEDFRAGVQEYINNLKTKKANLPGGPGSSPQNPYGMPSDEAAGAGQATDQPPAPNAKKAPDGNWYVPDPARPGKYLKVE